MTEQQPLKTRPIILRDWEVRGLLNGTVTQLWRAMEAGQYARSYHPYEGDLDDDGWPLACAVASGCLTRVECPWDDRVWGCETWCEPLDNVVLYRADGDKQHVAKGLPLTSWRSSATMPRCYSRITLEIEQVRALPVQSITEAGCCAALGCPPEWPGPGPEPYQRDLIGAFAARWDIDNPRHPWSSNPMAWRLVVRRVES